ncbi:MAG: hypothetical protein J6R52_03385 [Alphaproteobacteria bacterium]|nr:hypothetical protein [Alphaproteobacteria bacterium]
MKIKNVMFSGVMAAILTMSVGAAMAEGETAAISVASTGYVEAKVGALETSVQGVYQTKADAKTAADEQKLIDDKQTQDIKSNTEAINMLGGDSGAEGVATLVSDVNTNKTAIEKLNADAQTEGSVAYKIAQAVSDESLSKYTTDAELEGKGYQTAGDVQTAINNLNLGGNYQAKLDETQMKAVNSGVDADKVSGYDSVVSAVNNEKSGLVATYDIATANKAAIEAENTGLAAAHTAIATLNGADTEAGSVAYAVKGLADGAVATNTGAIATLNGADTEAGSVAHTVKGYAVPKPGANCAHAKCVLSVDQDGAPYWMELALSL